MARIGGGGGFRKRALARIVDQVFAPLRAGWLRGGAQQRRRRARPSPQPMRRMAFDTLEPRLLLNGDLNPIAPALVAEVFQAGQSVTLVDDDGTEVRFTLDGAGSGAVTPTAAGFDITVSGSNAASAVSVTAAGGDGRAKLHDLAVAGSLQSFTGAALDLTGDIAVSGTLGALTLGNIDAAHEITVSGAGVPLTFTAAHVVDLALDSASAIGAATVESWRDLDGIPDVIRAPSLGTLKSAGEFGASLDLTGQGVLGFTLTSAQIGGAITGGLWNVQGRAFQVLAQSTEADWQGCFTGALQTLTVAGDLSGQIATPAIQIITVGGDLDGAGIYAGANLGADGQFGGAGAAADTFAKGTLARLRIAGDIIASEIVIGVDPANGVFHDGDDRFVAGSGMQELIVGGTIAADSFIVSPVFPPLVRVNGVSAPPNAFPALRTQPQDFVAPVIAAGLANDTGTFADDALTRDPTVSGEVTDLGTIVQLLARLDDAAGFTDVTHVLAGGRFALAPALLDTLAGGSLADGAHVLHLAAVDGGGNSAGTEVAFTLDATAPAAPVVALDPASDSGAFDDDRITADATPTLNLAGEAGSTIALFQDGLASGDSTAGPSGSVTVAALADGTYGFNARATDAAGNVSSVSASVLVTIDTQAPALPSFDLAPAFDTAPIGDGQTTLASVTLEGTAEAQARMLLVETGAQTTADGTGGFQFAAVSLATGPNPLTARATDLAGNSSELARIITRVEPGGGDADPPVIVAALVDDTGRSATDGITRNPAIGGTVTDASAIVTLRAGLDATPQADFVDLLGKLQPDGTFALTPADLAALGGGVLAQGAHTLNLIAADDESNTSGVFAVDFTFDTVAPAVSAPDLLAASDSGASDADDITSDATPDIRVQAEDDALVRLFLDGNEAAQGIAGGGFIDFTLGPLADGAYLLTAIATDAAGNVRDAFGAPRVSIDTQAPAQPDFDLAVASDTDPAGDQRTTAGVVTLEGVTEPFARVLLVQTADETTADGAGAFQFTAVALAVGANDFTVRATDLAGNAAEFARTLTRVEVPGGETDPPVIAAALANDTGASAADGITFDPTVTGTITDASTIVSLRAGFDATPEASFVDILGALAPDGSFALDANALAAIAGGTLADGEHTLRLRATDAQGNASDIAALPFVLDTVAPALSIDHPLDGATLMSGAELSGIADGTGSPVASLLYTLGTLPPIAVVAAANGEFRQPLAIDALADGAHLLVVDATDAAGNAQSRSLTIGIEVPFMLTGHAPSDGMQRVGVQARPRIDFSKPVDPATVNAASFTASVGGTILPASVVVSNGGRLAWLYASGGLPGGAEVEVTVDGNAIRALDGTALDADGDGLPGGVLSFTFRTASTAALPGTTLSGRVLDVGPDRLPLTADDVAPGPDGSIGTDDDVFLLPVAGVPVFLLGLEDHVIHTDAQGRFHFDATPAGEIKLVIDGQEVAGPAGALFPEVILDRTLIAGRVNDLGAIYMPRLGADAYASVDAGATTTLTLAPGGAFGLTDAQRQQFTLTIAPDSLLSADGQRMGAGEVGLGTVPVELLAPLLPAGMPAPMMAFTVQTRGFADFAEPARLTLPNLSNAAPGTQFLLLTFDHTTKQLINDGTLVVSSAPGAPLVATLGSGLATASLGDHVLGTFGGTGITFACFHIVVPGSPADPCPPLAEPEVEVKPILAHEGLESRFFEDDEGELEFVIRNEAQPIDPTQDLCGPDNRRATPLILDITIEGPTGEFLIGLEGVSGRYGLLPGEEVSFPVIVKDLLGGNATYDRDRLYAASIRIVGFPANEPSNRLLDKEFYIYRYLDVADGFFDPALGHSAHTDGILEIADTTNDGLGGVVRERLVDMHMPAAIELNTTLLIADQTHFPHPATLDRFLFDPQGVGTFSTSVGFVTPRGELFADVLELKGEGRPKYKLFVNTAELEQVLQAIAENPVQVNLNDKWVTSAERTLFDDPGERAAIAADVRAGILSRFADFPGGIEAASGEGPNTITVKFRAIGDGTDLGTSSPPEGGDGVDNTAYIQRLAAIALEPGHGEGELSFLVAEALNRSPQSPVHVFVGTHLEGKTAPLNLSREQFIAALVKTGAHEAAHTLGAPHAAKSKLVVGNDEKQKVSFANLPGGITLAFNGSNPTAAILPSAAPEAVQDALATLPNLGLNISVSGGNGEFEITFNGLFMGIDVPELIARDAVTGNEIDVVSTQENGASTLELEDSLSFQGKEINRLPNRGRDDIMAQGFPDYDGDHRFLAGLSRELVKVGLHLGWTPEEALSGLAYLQDNVRLGTNTIFDDFEGAGEGPVLEGAHLGLFDPDRGAVFGTVDAGTVTADGPGGAAAVRNLQLVSLGDESVVIESIALFDPGGSWTVSPVAPGTVLGPGLGLPLQVAFDPLASGRLDAVLRITPAHAGGIREIALRGAGLSPAGDLRLEIANNNLGGVRLSDAARVVSDAATLRNIGASALTITAVSITGESAAQFGVAGLPAGFGAGNPLVLASGESFTFDLTFDASFPGLQRALIEIVSDDPDTPLLRRSLVGTGLADQGSALEYGEDFVAVEFTQSAGPAMRTISDAGGNWSLFLRAGEAFHSVIFDPASGLVAHGFGTTAAAGVATHLLSPLFRASTAPDSDGDGLPDDVELAIGSALDTVDTDSDGLDDFAEIRLGGDPLDGVAGRSGILGALPLAGAAWDIALDGTTAYIAAGDAGLAIADLSDPLEPILVGALDLLGVSSTVAVDGTRKLAVLGSQFIDPGLRIVDVSAPAKPELMRSVVLPDGVSHVEALDGVAYAASGSAMSSIELSSGEVLQTLALGGSAITGLAREGELLFAMDFDGMLSAIDISAFGMVIRDALLVAHGGGDVFVGGGIAYLANRNGFFGGFATVDVSDPGDLVLISGSDAGAIRPDRALAAEASGGVLIAGNAPDPQNPGLSIAVADLADASDPAQTGLYSNRFPLPESPLGVATAGGFGLIADAQAGLLVIGYRSDHAGAAPAVTLGTLARDVDPAAAGIQIAAGSLVHLLVDATDDVLVKGVELLVDGVRVATDLSFPFEAFLTPQATGPLALQARAIDIGGNVALSDVLAIDVVADTFAPVILAIDPADGASQAEGLRDVIIRFDEAIAGSSVTAATFRVVDSGGQTVGANNIVMRSEGRVVVLSFDGLGPGEYQIVISGSEVTDLAGNPLAAGGVVSRFTLTGDAIEWINPAGGFWDDPANWEGGVLPGPDDNVLIDVPGADVTITHRSGTTAVNRIVSRESLVLNGGTLDVATTLLVDGAFSIGSNATLKNATILPGLGAVPTVTSFATFDAVTLNTDLAVAVLETLQIRNGLELDRGRVLLAGAELAFIDAGVLNGSGEVVFSGIGAASRIIASGGPLTIGENVTIHGNRGRLDAFTDGIRLEGTVTADAAGETIVVDGSWVNAGRLIGGAGVLELDGTFTIENRGIFDATKGNVVLTGTLDNTGKTLTLDALSGSLAVDGGRILGGRLEFADGVRLGVEVTATLEGVTLGSDLALNGLRELIIAGGITLDGATIELIDDVAFFGPRLTFEGTQTLGGAGRILFTGPGDDGTLAVTTSTATLTIGPGISVEATAPSLGLSGQFVNQGVIAFETGTASPIFVTTASFLNEGVLRLLNGADITFQNLANAGTIALGAGSVLAGILSTLTVAQTAGTIDLQGGTINVGTLDLQGGILMGAGTIDANVINAARIEPGTPGSDATGTIAISNGNYTQSATGVLAIELGGTALADYDRLTIALIGAPLGTATLGGSLEVGLAGGFAPVAGNVFDIVTYEALAGGSTFATITGLDLGGGLVLQPAIEAARVRLQAVEASPGLASFAAAPADADLFVAGDAPLRHDARAAAATDPALPAPSDWTRLPDALAPVIDFDATLPASGTALDPGIREDGRRRWLAGFVNGLRSSESRWDKLRISVPERSATPSAERPSERVLASPALSSSTSIAAAAPIARI